MRSMLRRTTLSRKILERYDDLEEGYPQFSRGNSRQYLFWWWWWVAGGRGGCAPFKFKFLHTVMDSNDIASERALGKHREL